MDVIYTFSNFYTTVNCIRCYDNGVIIFHNNCILISSMIRDKQVTTRAQK